MLTVALVTANALAAEAIGQLLDETDLFRLVHSSSTFPDEHEIVRALRTKDPDILLLDIGYWPRVANLVAALSRLQLRVLTIGFREDWTAGQQEQFAHAGIKDLIREPFSPRDLERVVYEGLHREHPITNRNILSFLPAKAGGGCSTVALNTAAALANHFQRKVLLLEGDRRSGVFSIMLNLEAHRGISGALQEASDLTELSWRGHIQNVYGIDLLAADPARPGPMPSWIQYYQLLRFAQDRYDFMMVDLPEEHISWDLSCQHQTEMIPGS